MHTFLKLSFFLFTRWYVPPPCTSAEACVDAQLEGLDKCNVARNQTCLTMCAGHEVQMMRDQSFFS